MHIRVPTDQTKGFLQRQRLVASEFVVPSFGNYTLYLLFLVWNARGRIFDLKLGVWLCKVTRWRVVFSCVVGILTLNDFITENWMLAKCFQILTVSALDDGSIFTKLEMPPGWINEDVPNVSFEFTYFLYHLPQMMVFNRGKKSWTPQNSDVFCFLMLELFITFFVPSLFWVCCPYFILGTVWEKYLETTYVPKQRGRLARISEASVWSVHQARTCGTNLIYSESAGFSHRFGW